MLPGIPATAPTPETLAAGWRRLRPGQRCQVLVVDVGTGSSTVVWETDDALLEAPNWTPDGRWLVLNSDGLLYALAVDGSTAHRIGTGAMRDANNDHVLSPDGSRVYISSQDGHLYEVPLTGGEPRRVTDDADGLRARYLHGVSPDGTRLAHIGARDEGGATTYNVFTCAVADGATVQVTRSDRHHDGAEYSPDGRWIYVNSERGSTTPGHAQLFRMRPDGSEVTQLTHDERVNWFPHPSPDGTRLLHLSYGPGVQGHPADEPVQLRLSDAEGAGVTTVLELFGGQGTVNVNSWAPDSRRFACVAYPVAG